MPGRPYNSRGEKAWPHISLKQEMQSSMSQFLTPKLSEMIPPVLQKLVSQSCIFSRNATLPCANDEVEESADRYLVFKFFLDAPKDFELNNPSDATSKRKH